MTDNDTQSTERDKYVRKLAVQTGLPLTPTSATQIDVKFDSESIVLDYYPLKSIRKLMVDSNCIRLQECLIDKQAGIIFLPKRYTGKLYIQYTYCIPPEEFDAIIDLMMEYDNTPGWDKRASSITEGGVTVSLDTSTGSYALIQSMIDDLRLRYNTTARMI